MEEEVGKTTAETDSTARNLMPGSPIWTDDAMDFELDGEMLEDLMKLLEDDIVAPDFPGHIEPARSDSIVNAKIRAATSSETVSSTITDAHMDDGISLLDLLESTGKGTKVNPSAENQPWEMEMEHLLWPVDGKIDLAAGADVAGNEDEEWRACVHGGGELDAAHTEEGFGF